MIFRLLRGLGVLIAIAGAIDPPITSMRRTAPTVSVVSNDAADTALTDRVARELSPDFTIVRGPFAGAAAIVSVGDRLPTSTSTLPSSLPAFAVSSAEDAARVRITAVRAPARANVESRVPIETAVRVERSRGRTIDITLEQAGVPVDRITQTLASNDETIAANLTFAPTAEGATPLTIRAGVRDASARATDDLLVDVQRTRWAVLAFDRRPSWMATFVRRALESDPRFVVTSRVITSRNLSTDTGRPPGSFDDLPSLSLFDVVLVGAPEALTDKDVSGLDAFMRRRGGAVCFLFDRREPGPYERLVGTSGWSATTPGASIGIARVGVNAAELLATEIAWPTVPPLGGQVIASTVPAANDKTPARPVIWSVPAGAGRAVSSGALDAWRYRNAAPASFDRVWRTVVADAAASAPPLVDVDVDAPLLALGESTNVAIALRDATLAETSGRAIGATAHATLETPAGPETIRVWPTGAIGEFHARLRAPDTPGMYRLSITGNGTRTDMPIVVRPAVSRPEPDDRDLVAAWTASHGGITVPAARSREIEQALRRLLPADARRTTWHPMRSAWWIVPFAIALGAEWWNRRRAGLM